jgi:hypothetical protein
MKKIILSTIVGSVLGFSSFAFAGEHKLGCELHNGTHLLFVFDDESSKDGLSYIGDLIVRAADLKTPQVMSEIKLNVELYAVNSGLSLISKLSVNLGKSGSIQISKEVPDESNHYSNKPNAKMDSSAFVYGIPAGVDMPVRCLDMQKSSPKPILSVGN